MTSICICDCSRTDLETLYLIDQAAFGVESYSACVLRQFYDVFGNWLRLAKYDTSTIVGYTLGAPQPASQDGWVLSLAVPPEHQNRGIAKMLTRDLLERFRSSGIRTAWLTVAPKNERAIRLYRSLGFVDARFEEDYFGKGHPRNVMMLRFGGSDYVDPARTWLVSRRHPESRIG